MWSVIQGLDCARIIRANYTSQFHGPCVPASPSPLVIQAELRQHNKSKLYESISWPLLTCIPFPLCVIQGLNCASIIRANYTSQFHGPCVPAFPSRPSMRKIAYKYKVNRRPTRHRLCHADTTLSCGRLSRFRQIALNMRRPPRLSVSLA